ncbi:MAG: type II toxin-antitoxin system VapC family toxin [Candidatus Bathyarchaeia archaeon]
MKRFVDSNVFIYALTGHPQFGKTAKKILERIEKGEAAVTSTIVLCEIAWVLEAMGRQGDIKPTLEKILSYKTLEVAAFNEDDLLVGANNMTAENIDFNDGVNLALMMRLGVAEVYSNDQKHLGKLDLLKLVFS